MHPEARVRRTALMFVLVLLAFTWTAGTRAQVVGLQGNRTLMIELKGPWKFHLGDDPRWSEPGFDDSAWPPIPDDKADLKTGDRDGVFAWYRTRVTFAGGDAALGFEMPRIQGSYEVFINGERIGGVGGLPPHAHQVGGPGQVFEIPPGAVRPDGVYIVSIRIWYFDFVQAWPSDPKLGDAAFVWSWATLERHNRFWWDGNRVVQVTLELLGAFAGFLLFSIGRSRREYLWFAMFELLAATYDACVIYTGGALYPVVATHTVLRLESGLHHFFVLQFVVALLDARRNWLYWVANVAAVTIIVARPCAMIPLASNAFEFIDDAAIIPFVFGMVALLLIGAWQKKRDAQFLVFPIAAAFLTEVAYAFEAIGNQMGMKPSAALGAILEAQGLWPFPYSVSDATQVLLAVSATVLLILRFMRVQTGEERLAGEMESARQAQTQLVPINLPQPKHLRIEAAYVPAAEVGGDFYQVAQGDDDSTLLIVGDVSGKGLKAAMKGTLAIGAFRALAGQGLGPAELLNRLNRELLSGLDGGFITCVCARVTANGGITLANAGHIPPYVNGKEVECVSGFPLGILVTGYSEITLNLKPGDQMTLMSDGVVEAQNAKGELFGFDRTAALSALSAVEIARAAQHFGQEDDITVLTMALLPG